MGYPTLDYDTYIADYDYWHDNLGIEPPAWADEVYALGGRPIPAVDFYPLLFEGDEQHQLEPHRTPDDYRTGEYGAIAVESVPHRTKTGKLEYRGRRTTVTRDCIELIDLIDRSENFCMIAPVSYIGLTRTDAHARWLYALTLEIDDVEPKAGVKEIFYCWQRKTQPLPHPTFVVCSGNGLHLYYVLQHPIPLFENVLEILRAVKRWFVLGFWTPITTVTEKIGKKIQFEAVTQPFRLVGTRARKKHVYAMGFQTGPRVTVEYLNLFLPSDIQIPKDYHGKTRLAEAKELWPDWYKRRIIQKKPRKVFPPRNPKLYESWKTKIFFGARVGHRYSCLENLCALAVQCKIPREQVEADCAMLMEHFEKLTTDEDNHFTERDVRDALQTYYKADESAYRRTVEYVSAKTGIPLTRNRRNGRTQTDHLKRARLVQSVDYPSGSWRNTSGAPTKKDVVQAWRESHPDGRKADCVRETGLSKPTVYKWWNAPDDDGDNDKN